MGSKSLGELENQGRATEFSFKCQESTSDQESSVKRVVGTK